MKLVVKKYWKEALTVAFGLAVMMFWAVPYRAVLNYHEQFQLFLIDGGYLWSRIATVGGLSVWLSEFLVQFYNNFWLGAAVLALEFVAVQRLSWQVMRKSLARMGKHAGAAAYALSFLPAAFLWLVLGDFNVMHSLVVAVIIALALLDIILSFRRLKVRVAAALVALPLFWLTSWTHHYRLAGVFPLLESVYDADLVELLEYDQLVRQNNWQAVIAKAERRQPDVTMSVCAANLALGSTNQLLNRAQMLSHNSAELLLPRFNSEPFSTLTTAEAYFQLGLVNLAQRLFFEAMEGIPNYNKSPRCLRRLAETNIINGQYGVARKYLMILRKTMFYGKWAERTLAMIDGGDAAVESHPLYGRMRRMALDDHSLFSEGGADMLFGRLFLKDSSNSLAMQYLLLYPQLEGNREKYMQYLEVVKSRMN